MSNEAQSFEEKRDVFREEIFDWTDNYTENLASSAESSDAKQARTAIVGLWNEFAQMELIADDGGVESSFNIFAEAACDPVAGAEMELYEFYVTLLRREEVKHEAAKSASAFQYAFLHGLSDGRLTSHDNVATLWNSFLEAYNSITGTSAIDMNTLYTRARALMKDDRLNGAILSLPPSLHGAEPEEDESSGKEGEEEEEEAPTEPVVKSEAGPEDVQREQAPGGPEPPLPEVRLTPLDTCEGFTPELVVKKFHQCPPLLFEPLSSEEAMRKLPPLRPEDRRILQEYVGMELTDRRMPQHCSWLLDIIEGLWIAQSLKERDYASWFSELEQQHKEERIRTKERSVRGSTGTSMSELEAHNKKLESKLTVQRELLTAVVNKSLLGLLSEQFTVLTQIAFPHFSKEMLERLEAHVVNHQLGTIPTHIDSSLKERLTRQQQMLSTLLLCSGRLKTHTAQLKPSKITRFSNNPEVPGLTTVVKAPPQLVVPEAPKLEVPTPATRVAVKVEATSQHSSSAVASGRGKRKAAEVAPAPAPAPRKAVKKEPTTVATTRGAAKVQLVDMDAAAAIALEQSKKPATRRSARNK
uniref:Uncharacterized protein n=1 Tax=uncultured organism MedDCM-OCT-S04-C12 TaxID=743608 RepID=D6PJ17_9ZZZZ|nr:hypothetical protein [uncultured organism MedDCM-OCT-S04-C12]